MRHYAAVSAFLFGALALAACTHLIAYKLPPEDEYAPLPASAFPYALARTRLQIAVTVTLSNCSTLDQEGSKRKSLGVTVTATPIEVIEADPDERYYVDYSELQSFWKTTSFALNRAENGTIQGVNTERSDQTMQIVGAAAQSAIDIAGGVATAGVSVAAIGTGKQLAAAGRGNLVETQTLAIASGALGDIVTRGKPAHKAHAAPDDPGACTKEAFDYWKKGQAAATKLANNSGTNDKPASETAADPQLTKEANTVVDATKHITASFVLEPKLDIDNINEAPGERHDDIFALKINMIATAGAVAEVGAFTTDTDAVVVYNNGQPIPYSRQVTLEVRVKKWSFAKKPDAELEDWSVGNGRQATHGQTQYDGLIVRDPAVATLRMCVDECGHATDDNGIRYLADWDKDKQKFIAESRFGRYKIGSKNAPNDAIVEQALIPETQLWLPQFGKKIRMPLHDKIARDGTLTLTLGQSGSLNVLSFKGVTDAAAGLQALGGAGTAYGAAATSVDNAITSRNTALNAGVTYATGNTTIAVDQATYADSVLKAQADCIQQQTAIIKGGATPKADCK